MNDSQTTANRAVHPHSFDQGFSAWITGKSRDENPHRPGSREWEAWDHGWVEAEEND